MDKLMPNRLDEDGLPTYPPHIERQIRRTFASGLEPSEALEELTTTWIWERASAIRAKKQHYPGNQEKVHREMGWETRRQRESKKRKRTHEDTRGNGKNSPVGPVETRTEEWEGLQGPLPDLGREGQQY